MYDTYVKALFDIGASINALSFKFFSHIQQHVKLLPTNRKIVSADSNSLGPVGEVHLKFKVGKIVFNDMFVILNNLQKDIILGLPWQHNYMIGCTRNREGKHLLTIKNKLLALSLTLHLPNQSRKTKGQCTLQSRSITWISVKTPRTIQANNLLEITFDRQLPKGLIPLDVLHSIKHKQPQEMLTLLLNIMNTIIKLPMNTILGSVNKVDNVDSVQSSYSLKHHNVKADTKSHPSKPLLPAFPNSFSFTTHGHDSDKSPIQLQDANVPLEIQHKLNTMLTNKFAEIISKSSADLGQINLIEMDLPTTGPPVSTKLYIIPLKYKTFIDEEIKLLEDARCISKSLSDWASQICIMKKKPDLSQPDKPQLHMCINYRKVNQSLITACNNSNGKIVSTFPLPKIQELLSCLNRCKYFSSLYLHSDYYHISLAEDAKKKTAFVTADGKYQWNVVPFGLGTAFSMFQYLISTVLTGLNNFAFTYLDDVLAFSEMYEDHSDHLNVVFENFQKAGLKIKLSKCQFFKSHLHYLGRRISANGLEPLPEKLEAIKNLVPARNIDETHHIL